MTLKTVVQYLLGSEQAIREVARQKSSLWVGIVLVLTAGIAREYDQAYFFAEPHKFFEPLLISFFSAIVIFLFIFPLNVSTHPPGFTIKPGESIERPAWITFRQFLSLFWMMAPIAWLYAIPFERFLTPGASAEANITLLCIVAGWRVLLMARVASVLSTTPYARALFTVLLPSSFMVFIASVGTSMSLIRLMGGMRHSPEESVLAAASAVGVFASFVIGAFSLIAMAALKRSTLPATAEVQIDGKLPYVGLLAVLALWVGIAIYPQKQLAFNLTSERLARSNPKELLAFLSRHERNEFSPARRLPPDPYSYAALEQVPEIVMAMDGSEAQWVRRHYLDCLRVVLGQRMFSRYLHDKFLNVLQALSKLPEGGEWAVNNRDVIVNALENGNYHGVESNNTALLDALTKLGIVDAEIKKLLTPEEKAPAK